MTLKRLPWRLMPAALMALSASPLWADTEEARKAGLPQLDTRFYPSQLFWLAVSFAILYVLMARLALPGVERTQKKRADLIAGELAAAQTANEEAKRTIAEYEKAIAQARADAIAAEDMTSALKESVQRQADQQKQLNEKIHAAEARIAASRDAALKEVEASARDLAAVTIEKVTGLKLQVRA